MRAAVAKARAGIKERIEQQKRTAPHRRAGSRATGAAHDHRTAAQAHGDLARAAGEEDDEAAPHRLSGQRPAASIHDHGHAARTAASGQGPGEPGAGIAADAHDPPFRLGGGEIAHIAVDLDAAAGHAEPEFGPGITHHPDGAGSQFGSDAVAQAGRALEDEHLLSGCARAYGEELAQGHRAVAEAQRKSCDRARAFPQHGLGAQRREVERDRGWFAQGKRTAAHRAQVSARGGTARKGWRRKDDAFWSKTRARDTIARMREHVLFLTGRLAEPRLRRVLEGLGETPFSWEIRQMGVQVAALMTPEIIRRRLGSVAGVSKVILPGRVRGDLAPLADFFGVPFERGPEELDDLPAHLGRKGPPPDLSRYECRIFAEIVEAPELTVEAILARARALAAQGADVIDLGCLPGRPFPHLEEAIAALKAEGFCVSIDSGDLDELRRGARAGADFLLSLSEDTLALAFESAAVPVLIPARPGDLESLVRACERLAQAGKPYLADPILDPIHFGFTASLLRYSALRARLPEAEMLMGVGNLTELTDADTTGITMLLMAVCSELAIRNVLVVQVSPHCRRAVVEADRARRILFAAKERNTTPQGIDPALLCLRDRRPFPEEPEDIAAEAAQIRDPNFRIRVARDGVHIFNRAGHHVSCDPYSLFPLLGVERDGAHAFYLGYELAKAEIAFKLGKRYVQDEPLRWGCAVDLPQEDLLEHKAPGATLSGRGRAERES